MKQRQPRRKPLDRRLSSPEVIVDQELAVQGPRLHAPRTNLDSDRRGRYLREIDGRRRAFQSGNLGALFDALLLCRTREFERFQYPEVGALGPGEVVHAASDDFSIEIPAWVWDGATRVVHDYVQTAKIGRSGRTARWLQQWRQDMIDFARWEAVKILREKGVKFSLDEVWRSAARDLQPKSPAAGSPDAIKRSYARVEKRMRTEPFRYKRLTHIRVGNL